MRLLYSTVHSIQWCMCWYHSFIHSSTNTIRSTRIDSPRPVLELNLEPIPSHAVLILLDQGLAVGLWVAGLGEEHAVIAGALFFLAHAAWLLRSQHIDSTGG